MDCMTGKKFSEPRAKMTPKTQSRATARAEAMLQEIRVQEHSKNGMRPIHPGEILHEEFLLPLGLTVGKLAEATKIERTWIEGIIAGRRGVTANTALRLSKAFGTTPEFWMNMQTSYAIRKQEMAEVAKDVRRLV